MLKTPLHGHHVDLDAKMGAFAGYDMPLYYALGVLKEHNWVRDKAGLFDISHMGQVMLRGNNVAAFLEKITPSSFVKKGEGRAQYTVLTNEEGGIIDDLIITRMGENEFFAVLNAARKDDDLAWIRQHCPEDITIDYWDSHALIALQGPEAESALRENLGVEASDLPYMHAMPAQAVGADIIVSRVGYTGEDGFEISIASDSAAEIWNKLLAHDAVEPIGLAARDSLRLDMGYPLYGHDIDTQTSPVEADLNWIIRKEASGYIGENRIKKERAEGTTRKRVGFRLLDKGIAREGAVILNEREEEIGRSTSGGFSPSLEQAVGQGYVTSGDSAPGTKIFLNVRGRNIAAEVTPMPFITPKTKSMKKKAA